MFIIVLCLFDELESVTCSVALGMWVVGKMAVEMPAERMD